MAFSIRPWWWIVWLWPMSVTAAENTDDRAVLQIVLNHFSVRKDASFYTGKSAIVAIAPLTEETFGPDSDYRYLNQGEDNCAIPESLYLSLRRRNATATAATNLVTKSHLWRVVDVEEAKANDAGWPPLVDKKRGPIKTLVTLTKPGYSSDGGSAFVNLSFIWSIHGAEARYVLKRGGSTWKVACSQLVFYV